MAKGSPVLARRDLLCRPEGLLYQVKSLLFWPGASCVLKWASYIGQRASYINHGASRNRGPPAYTRRHVPCVSQGLLMSARASLYLPGASWVGQNVLSALAREIPISGKGPPVSARGPLVSARGPISGKRPPISVRGPPT